MPDSTLRNARDTLARQDLASRNFAGSHYLDLMGSSRYVYVFFNRAAPLTARITSAKLRLFHRGGWGAGSRTITARRIGGSWQVSRLTWNNKPSVTGAGATVTDNGGPDGVMVEIDVTAQLQAVSDGAAWHGWRLESTDATLRQLYSAVATDGLRPQLYVAWTTAPLQPTTLSPSGGRATSLAKPVLGFDFTDDLGDTSLAAVQVQIDPNASGSAPQWEWTEPTTEPHLDLATTTYPGLAAGASTQWHVRVQDGSGLWSPYSDWQAFSRATKGTVTIQSPGDPPGNVVNEPTPPIVFGFVPGGGGAQRAWQVLVIDPGDPSTVYADSGRQTGTDQAYTLPRHTLVDPALTYRAIARVWDSISREATPGDPVYAFDIQDFTVTDVGSVARVVGLTATPVQARPRIILTWSRATAPDFYTIRRDGQHIEDDLDPSDVLLDAQGNYSYTDDGGLPWRDHTWQVRAVVNGQQSGSDTVTATPLQYGIWLSDKGKRLTVWLAGDDQGSWAQGEDASVVAPLGSTRVVRRIQSQRGYEGSLSGLLIDKFGTTALQYEADLLAMRRAPTRPVQLALGDISLNVILGNIASYPTPNRPPMRAVSFDFWEVP